ncbi:hypothetical protein [Solicola gregarius]|uniref:Uncharacterized protein n=1 Tax=Solicola gregarius TaxID=2908642 RepID=A0AA46TEP2_9ACTN|nr:hypothetical protein [Solicola gregarius]UYM03813.1 hypothetical protein L0C25_14825 [Solicola gregarius]
MASVRPASMRERAEAQIDGRQWTFRKQHGELVAGLAGEPEPRLVASRPSVLRQAWDIRTGARTYRIEPMGFLHSGFRVLRDGSEVGTGGKASFWSNRPTLDVDPAIPQAEQVFLLWVSFIMRRRATAAASSSSGGA